MEERKFNGVWIPREIWLDERLNALDKIILTEIDSLDNGDEHCHAGNDYLAQFCQCSASKVTKTISKLIELGYVQVHSFDGRVRRLRSCLVYCTPQDSKIYEAEQQNVRPINISINQSIKHTPRKSAKSVFTDGFDEFWAAYPKPVAKNRAAQSWAKLKPDEELRWRIIADIRRRMNGEWRDIDEKYIPYPATYLNQHRWEDEHPAPDPEPTPGPYHDGLTDEERQRKIEEMNEAERRKEWGEDWFERYTKK